VTKNQFAQNFISQKSCGTLALQALYEARLRAVWGKVFTLLLCVGEQAFLYSFLLPQPVPQVFTLNKFQSHILKATKVICMPGRLA
jgi:hypothetical protein